MTDLDDITARTEALAAARRWTEACDLLAAAAIETILGHETLAFRFAESLYYTARFPDLARYAVAYEESARRSSDGLGVMRAINLAGIAAFELGRMDEARQRFEALMGLALAERHEEMQAHAANNLGTIASLRGDHEAALCHYGRCLRLYERLDQVRGVAQTTYNQGLTYSELGRFADAVTQFDRAIALSESIGHTSVVVMARTARAELEVRRGDAGLGRALADRAIELAREIDDPVSIAEALRVRALATSGVLSAALDDLARAEELASETEQALLGARILRDRGRILLGAGQHAPGTRCLDEATERFAALDAAGEVRTIRAELARLASSSRMAEPAAPDDHGSPGAAGGRSPG